MSGLWHRMLALRAEQVFNSLAVVSCLRAQPRSLLTEFSLPQGGTFKGKIMSEFLIYFKGDETAQRMDAEGAVASLVWASKNEQECYVTLQNARGGLVACSHIGLTRADYWVSFSGPRYEALNDLADRANALLTDDEWVGSRFEADIVPPESCSYRPTEFRWAVDTLTRTATSVRAAL